MITTKFQVLPHCKCSESFTALVGTSVCIFSHSNICFKYHPLSNIRITSVYVFYKFCTLF